MVAIRVRGGSLPWVASSGGKGLRSLTVRLDRHGQRERTYTVRLHFLEPDRLKRGERVFDVALQGRRVLERLDIVREAGGADRALVKEFRGVRVAGELIVTLSPAAGEAILSGVEVIAEGW